MANSVDIEIILKSHSNITKQSLVTVVRNYLETRKVPPNSVLCDFSKDEIPFHSHVKSVIVGNIPSYQKPHLDFNDVQVNWFVYMLDSFGPIAETETNEDGEQINISTHLGLPSLELFDLWENLYYEDDVKENLLRYARSMMDFADKKVNPNIVSCNRVILMHGPPGTGKTSLSKALAHKLSIQLSDRFSSGLLIEINSHSLFSKWFSESGKLVNNMFSKIREICENEKMLVCLLIDEVESLAHARDQCVSGTEPSDSIRVVNAMLTQLDQIKRFPNVLILATSNMTEAIDIAFISRADIKQYLGPPTVHAMYKIYQSCLTELFKAKIIKPMDDNDSGDDLRDCGAVLNGLCEKSVGLSGRSLRKIPFLAYALFLTDRPVDLARFLHAMELAVEREHSDRKLLMKT
ncbi:pachytene checkpoint protein 2 homolog [Cylas formicarius]|uniref:pachytene checkpoint protein 2 homolog n=1 Tax=Cylas formicarius TaxID=197179 RepID=UPI002958D8EC|nr:pachytene checkpoint protein 2 homolog [Cylas formicarius]